MSGVADTAGAPVAVIGDLDALAFDNAGALTWMSQGSAGPVTLPHFLFSGDTLDGAAVLSTQALGSIAVVNGQPLASAAPMPTTGTQMGLLPGTNPVVLPIGNLCLLDHESVRVVADASPKQPVAGGTMLIEVGGCDALAPLVLMMQIGTATAFGAATGAGITNPGFGLGYAGVPPMMLGGLAADAAGLVTLAAPYGGGILAGLWVAMQPVTAKAGIPAVVVGGPVLLQF